MIPSYLSVSLDSQLCIKVESILFDVPAKGQYFEYDLSLRSFRTALNYLRRVGVMHVFTKIRSRLYESKRNDKHAVVGVGTVVSDVVNSSSNIVLFFHYSCSILDPYLVIEKDLSFPLRCIPSPDTSLLRSYQELVYSFLLYLSTWSPFSGRNLDQDSLLSISKMLVAFLDGSPCSESASSGLGSTAFQPLSSSAPSDSFHTSSGRDSAVIFGLGNYAKTNIVPNIDPLKIRRVHEIDPSQLLTARTFIKTPCTLSTSPLPDFSEFYGVWFIAGYHHTHSPLAIEALQRGAIPIIEKPMFTAPEQYSRFVSFAAENACPFYVCFHKRYSSMHSFFLSDVRKLSYDPALPFDMHCIVYEVPLPPLHWYRWPNSGSRLISNGCHWLDYFMFVNQYSPVASLSVASLTGSKLNCSVSLENGAVLTLVLTEEGSPRVGVRDHIEIRFGGNTVRMVDSCSYQLETPSSISRRRRVNPLSVYGQMYSSIVRSILSDGVGDSLNSLRSSKLALDLEATISS